MFQKRKGEIAVWFAGLVSYTTGLMLVIENESMVPFIFGIIMMGMGVFLMLSVLSLLCFGDPIEEMKIWCAGVKTGQEIQRLNKAS